MDFLNSFVVGKPNNRINRGKRETVHDIFDTHCIDGEYALFLNKLATTENAKATVYLQSTLFLTYW